MTLIEICVEAVASSTVRSEAGLMQAHLPLPLVLTLTPTLNFSPDPNPDPNPNLKTSHDEISQIVQRKLHRNASSSGTESNIASTLSLTTC